MPIRILTYTLATLAIVGSAVLLPRAGWFAQAQGSAQSCPAIGSGQAAAITTTAGQDGCPAGAAAGSCATGAAGSGGCPYSHGGQSTGQGAQRQPAARKQV